MDEDIIRENRRLLHGVPQWIGGDCYRRSRNGYGCPPRLLPLLDRPISDDPTYTDLLVLAAARLGEPITYLELGVSVGKNFLVMAKALEHAHLVGFDLEPINPVLAAHFEELEGAGSVARYRCGSNAISYVQGDLADPACWRPLTGLRFNLIFSDAAHHPGAILHETGMLERLGLFDDRRCLCIWDDLDRCPDGPLTRAFRRIGARLARRWMFARESMFLVELNGWLGQHEHPHMVGVINNGGLTPASFGLADRASLVSPDGSAS